MIALAGCAHQPRKTTPSPNVSDASSTNEDHLLGVGGTALAGSGSGGTIPALGGVGGTALAGSGSGGRIPALGGLGTIGVCSNASRHCSGSSRFVGRSDVRTKEGPRVVEGKLDKAVIQRIIRRRLNQIRYCYERELTKEPNLAGRVVVKFVIGKEGEVSAANVKSTTMNHATAEKCFVGRFMRMQFPKPTGGGVVIVNYPLVFSTVPAKPAAPSSAKP